MRPEQFPSTFPHGNYMLSPNPLSCMCIQYSCFNEYRILQNFSIYLPDCTVLWPGRLYRARVSNPRPTI